MTQNKYIIMKALRMSELQYGTMVMDYAQAWMRRYFGMEQTVIDALNKSGFFWKWWTKQWDNRDREFMRITEIAARPTPLDLTTWKVTKRLYELHHDADDLVIVPNKKVVREVGGLIKKEKELIKQLRAK